MKLQETSKRELKRISAGVLIGSAVMIGVFAVIGKFAWPVVWGALLGDAVAIGNFFYLCLSVQKAAAADETKARLVMRSSYTMRMLITIVGLTLGLTLDIFHWVAVLIPLLLPRVTILIMQLTGIYRPVHPAPADNGPEEE